MIFKFYSVLINLYLLLLDLILICVVQLSLKILLWARYCSSIHIRRLLHRYLSVLLSFGLLWLFDPVLLLLYLVLSRFRSIDFNLDTLCWSLCKISLILLHLLSDLRLNMIERFLAYCLVLRQVLPVSRPHVLTVELLPHLLCACRSWLPPWGWVLDHNPRTSRSWSNTWSVEIVHAPCWRGISLLHLLILSIFWVLPLLNSLLPLPSHLIFVSDVYNRSTFLRSDRFLEFLLLLTSVINILC